MDGQVCIYIKCIYMYIYTKYTTYSCIHSLLRITLAGNNTIDVVTDHIAGPATALLAAAATT
jgi:hypothetical protein